ncbi:hypothetical protein STEG23_013262 [Scotinomys teguina]
MLHGLPGNPTSSLPGGLASSPCCLALDSSSSFPCPAFLAIAKSKYSSGLAATFKDLKIWKQALRKGTTENSSSEYGKCGAKGSSLEQRLGFFPESVG